MNTTDLHPDRRFDHLTPELLAAMPTDDLLAAKTALVTSAMSIERQLAARTETTAADRIWRKRAIYALRSKQITAQLVKAELRGRVVGDSDEKRAADARAAGIADPPRRAVVVLLDLLRVLSGYSWDEDADAELLRLVREAENVRTLVTANGVKP